MNKEWLKIYYKYACSIKKRDMERKEYNTLKEFITASLVYIHRKCRGEYKREMNRNFRN